MPKGPKGEKRPADVIGAAIKVARIATGEDEDTPVTPESEGKDAAAVSMGKRGGAARAAKLKTKLSLRTNRASEAIYQVPADNLSLKCP